MAPPPNVHLMSTRRHSCVEFSQGFPVFCRSSSSVYYRQYITNRRIKKWGRLGIETTSKGVKIHTFPFYKLRFVASVGSGSYHTYWFPPCNSPWTSASIMTQFSSQESCPPTLPPPPPARYKHLQAGSFEMGCRIHWQGSTWPSTAGATIATGTLTRNKKSCLSLCPPCSTARP